MIHASKMLLIICTWGLQRPAGRCERPRPLADGRLLAAMCSDCPSGAQTLQRRMQLRLEGCRGQQAGTQSPYPSLHGCIGSHMLWLLQGLGCSRQMQTWQQGMQLHLEGCRGPVRVPAGR